MMAIEAYTLDIKVKISMEFLLAKFEFAISKIIII